MRNPYPIKVFDERLQAQLAGDELRGVEFAVRGGRWVEGFVGTRWYGGMSPGSTSEITPFGAALAFGGQADESMDRARAQTWLKSLDASNGLRRLRTIPGRTTYTVEIEGRLLVVKATTEDLARERWYDRFHGQPGRLPGQREFDNLCELRAAGFRVPQPRMWVRDEAGRSLVAMDFVPHRQDLFERLAAADVFERRIWIERLAVLVAELHNAGFYHRDLYLTHIVLDESEEQLVLLDVGRVRRELSPRRRWFVKDLAALYHSRPNSFSAAESLRFLATYLEHFEQRSTAASTCCRPTRLNRWARRVSRKERRIAAHSPKFNDPLSVRETSTTERVLD